jgi:O-antigen ligase
MPPLLALLLWFILLVGLWCFDPAKGPKTSAALWVPLIWLFIVGSRLPSQWLSGDTGQAAAALEEGNLLDRSIFLILILLAVGILTSRSFKWGAFFAHNSALTAFLCFALLSACWSDFPFIAFKRWFRDLGNYVVILVVLSDPRPLEAFRTLFRRLCYLLIPLSIVIVKYFPAFGRKYDDWLGTAMYLGATTSKNMLGAACLISGLFFFWDTFARWADRKDRRTRRIILVNVAFIAMTLWLLNLAHSATSSVCLALGCMVVAAAHSKAIQRSPVILKFLIPVSFFLYLIVAFGFGMMGNLAAAVGRNPTLTDRTAIWKILLSIHTNPLIGTGYQSFWLGPRLARVWELYTHINEAHNGYLDVYLNLGIIGLFLLGGFLIVSYQTIWRRFKPFTSLASLTLAVWTILLFYNMTEAAFQGGLLWLTFLPGALAVSERRVRTVAESDNAGATEELPNLPLEVTGA